MLVFNSDKSTLKLPHVDWKMSKPRSTIKSNSLPLNYIPQSWSGVYFFNCFLKLFVPSVTKFLIKEGLPLKAFLQINNVPTYTGVDELTNGDISVQFLPASVTSWFAWIKDQLKLFICSTKLIIYSSMVLKDEDCRNGISCISTETCESTASCLKVIKLLVVD